MSEWIKIINTSFFEFLQYKLHQFNSKGFNSILWYWVMTVRVWLRLGWSLVFWAAMRISQHTNWKGWEGEKKRSRGTRRITSKSFEGRRHYSKIINFEIILFEVIQYWITSFQRFLIKSYSFKSYTILLNSKLFYTKSLPFVSYYLRIRFLTVGP